MLLKPPVYHISLDLLKSRLADECHLSFETVIQSKGNNSKYFTTCPEKLERMEQYVVIEWGKKCLPISRNSC